jgi:hypothetical protein
MNMTKIEAGQIVEAVGLGKMFVELVVGSSGQGEVVHIGYGDGTYSTTEFEEKARFKTFFEEQYEEGIFYRDNGCDEVLWLALEDAQVIG